LEQNTKTITLYTIGFAKKSAEDFFSLLKATNIRTLIDIRLNNVSQLAGFTKRDDLKYFLKEICNIGYMHLLDFAPTNNILDAYKKKKISWDQYESDYRQLLKQREVENKVSHECLDMACLLCSEPKPEHCHRRLLAEYLRDIKGNIIIRHL
jgi:uncharacterized protein (DUF488 family)